MFQLSNTEIVDRFYKNNPCGNSIYKTYLKKILDFCKGIVYKNRHKINKTITISYELICIQKLFSEFIKYAKSLGYYVFVFSRKPIQFISPQTNVFANNFIDENNIPNLKRIISKRNPEQINKATNNLELLTLEECKLINRTNVILDLADKWDVIIDNEYNLCVKFPSSLDINCYLYKDKVVSVFHD